MEFDAEVLGAKIRLARKRKGWTQYRLRREAGLTGNSVIADIEQGKRPHVSFAQILAIAEALGVSLDELTSDDQPAALVEVGA